VIESAAYRGCGVHARAILVELVARMNGWNNGSIAASHRELRETLRCGQRKVVRGLAELMEHGIIDVAVEGKWKERLAREYRLTFVSTKQATATNDYRSWTARVESGASAVGAEKARSAPALGATDEITASGVGADAKPQRRKTAISQNRPASAVGALISKPYGSERNGGVSWWGADAILKAQTAAHVSTLAWIGASPMAEAA
jgi:hypothetical protein